MPIKWELVSIATLFTNRHFPESEYEGIADRQALLIRYIASYCTTVAPGSCTDYSPFSVYSKPVLGTEGGEVACEEPDETAVSCSSERFILAVELAKPPCACLALCCST